MERVRLRWTVVCAAEFFVGSAAALFLAGPALFADGDMRERVWLIALIAIVYAGLGLAGGALAPGVWKAAAACLLVPLAPVLVLFGGDAVSSMTLASVALGVVLAAVATALFGAWYGARWVVRRAERADAA